LAHHWGMRRLIATVVVVALLAVAAIVVVRPFRSGQKVETATVTRGSLDSTVELAGSLGARETRALSFGTAGTIATIGVAVGDAVAKGQVLATLDSTVAAAQVKASEAALGSAKARLAGDRAGLTDAQRAQAKDPVTQAQQALSSGQSAETTARQHRDAAITAAQATVDQAEARLAADTVAGAPAKILADDALAVQAAEASLGSVKAQADASVTQATAAVTSARSALTAAQHAYAVRTAAAPDALISSDEAAIASAEASLAAARQSLLFASITSPIDGTVTEVGLRVGDRAGLAGSSSAVGALPGTAGDGGSGRIVVADLSALRIDSTASEIDVVNLALGQTATITLDALRGLSLTAKICDLGRNGSSASGVVEYPVTLCLDGGDPGLRTGMSANISIVLAHRDGALLVPTPAIATVAGRSVARVLRPDGSIDVVGVEIGISSGTRLEVLSGLSEGDKVVIGAGSGG
jgi:macrolide-specific efflux system membrane fusion protein